MSLAAPHVGYVIAAYILTGVVLVGLITAITLQLRGRQRHLRALESRIAGRQREGALRKEHDSV